MVLPVRQIFLLLLMMSCLTVASAQRSVQGMVTDSLTGQPVGAANVYLANTQTGTLTTQPGSFILNGVPPGKFELIVSCVGYEVFRYTILPGNSGINLHVKLKPRVAELKEVVLRNSEKFGWEKWGSFFFANVIGTSIYAEETELLNEDVLRFYFDARTSLLTATAKDRLHIRNKALGYDIRFDLTAFSFDTLTREFTYQGYPFFEELTTTREGLKRRWQRNRENTYYGSLMHFYRSLYDTTLYANGFEVRPWGFLKAEEKKRVKKLYTAYQDFMKSDNNLIGPNPYSYLMNTDSLNYFKLVMQNEGDEPMLLDTLLGARRLVQRNTDSTVFFQFRDSLQVRYVHKIFPAEFGRDYYEMRNRRIKPVTRPAMAFSNIYLTGDKPVIIYSNGAYTDGEVLHTSNYFSWSEKLATVLPYDFKPPYMLPEHVRKAQELAEKKANEQLRKKKK